MIGVEAPRAWLDSQNRPPMVQKAQLARFQSL
jgi:hypothetical protein